MRISDWSSDVCSSDLLASSTQRPSRPFARLTSLPWLGGQRKRRHQAFAGFGVADRRLSFLLHFLPALSAGGPSIGAITFTFPPGCCGPSPPMPSYAPLVSSLHAAAASFSQYRTR